MVRDFMSCKTSILYRGSIFLYNRNYNSSIIIKTPFCFRSIRTTDFILNRPTTMSKKRACCFRATKGKSKAGAKKTQRTKNVL